MPDEENDNLEDKLDFELEPLSEEGDDVPDTDAEDDSSVDPSLQMQITRVQEEVELLEQLVTRPPLLPSPFPATVGTDGSFTELCILNGSVSDFAAGRTGTAISLDTGQSVLMEVRDDPTMRFLVVGGGSGGRATGEFAVWTKQNGTDADGPLYDVFSDGALTTQIGTSLSPNELSRWRGSSGLDITAAPDGARGMAHYESGTLVLDLVSESVCTSDSFPWETG